MATATTATSPPKTSWADQVEEGVFVRPIPAENISQSIQDEIDENGIRTTIEYITNEEEESGSRSPDAQEEFFKKKGNAKGPDRATTTVGENVMLKISAGNKHANDTEKVEEESAKSKLNKAGAGKVVCRLCKGDHFTAKCPHKEALSGLELDPAADDDAPAPIGGGDSLPAPVTGGASSGGKYVPPSMRAGGSRAAGPTPGSREDLPTLRVTNISEDTQENDLRELFGMFGRVARVYVGRDRETGAGKGFAFVSFEDRAIAQKAMEKVNGKGYDNLILSVQWSQPRPEQR
ncbi:Eukaryotic translation initiation factor 3 subunit G [Mycena indigotica]|uniref:Eukaryotic translation initiation factor 3 subunit G n=1 Tax=Mycena indigotica TaxID=2126181 RepID=A0A8H6RY60_9AGAR|nr:Eukaryotic translation initiation factor 3 subunit G [Mycena indigotica]KAF7289925.1 Eukaryotic translation initiation factor 3 subunit G [Mycena indigotica]